MDINLSEFELAEIVGLINRRINTLKEYDEPSEHVDSCITMWNGILFRLQSAYVPNGN